MCGNCFCGHLDLCLLASAHNYCDLISSVIRHTKVLKICILIFIGFLSSSMLECVGKSIAAVKLSSVLLFFVASDSGQSNHINGQTWGNIMKMLVYIILIARYVNVFPHGFDMALT